MGRNLDPKCKQCRRAGEKLFLKGERCYLPKCAMVKKNYPPGLSRTKGKRRQSDYGLQLNEKQKVKRQYNMLEKQFRLTFAKAKKQPGDVGDNLLRLLEMRLDNTIYRLSLASSRNQARQLVSHGHVTVNGRKINIPSYYVKAGDVINIRAKSKKYKSFQDLPEKLKKADIPAWLHLDAKELSGKVLHKPTVDAQANINAQMIVEYYSR